MVQFIKMYPTGSLHHTEDMLLELSCHLYTSQSDSSVVTASCNQHLTNNAKQLWFKIGVSLIVFYDAGWLFIWLRVGQLWWPTIIYADLMSSFSRGLLSTTTQGLSDSAGLGAGMEGDLDGDGLPAIFLLVLGVASLFWTRWGKRSLRICSRSSSTIWWKHKCHELPQRKYIQYMLCFSDAFDISWIL